MPMPSRRGAEPVDFVLGAPAWQVQEGDQDEQGGAREGDVHVEDPAPRGVVGDQATDQRTGDHGQCHDAAHHSLVLAPVPGGDQVADEGERPDHQTAGAKALERTEQDQLGHRPDLLVEPGELAGRTGEHRAEDEQEDRSEEDPLAAVEVTELSPDRGRDGHAQHVCGDDPGQLGQSAQLPDNLGHGRSHDHVVEHRQHHCQQKPKHHDGDIDARSGAFGRRRRRGCLIHRCSGHG